MVNLRIFIIFVSFLLLGCNEPPDKNVNDAKLKEFSEAILAEWQGAKFSDVEQKTLKEFYDFRKDDFLKARSNYRKWVREPDAAFTFKSSRALDGRNKENVVEELLFAQESAIWSEVKDLEFIAVLLSSDDDRVVMVVVRGGSSYKLSSVPFSINSLQVSPLVEELFPK